MKYKASANYVFIPIIILLFLVILLQKKDISSLDSLITSSKRNKQNLTILIEVDKKKLYLIDRDNENVIDTYAIASGKYTSPTPLGSFHIVEKAYWGEGFGSRWIGLDVPWGKYGIHGTNQPGSIGGNVSSGCIRSSKKIIQ